MDVVRVRTEQTTCTIDSGEGDIGWSGFSATVSSPAINRFTNQLDCANAFADKAKQQYPAFVKNVAFSQVITVDPPSESWTLGVLPGNPTFFVNISMAKFCKPYPDSSGQTPNSACPITYTKVTNVNAYNKGNEVVTKTPDTGFCQITGWSYTDKNGVDHTIPASVCAMPNIPDKSGPGKLSILGNPSVIQPAAIDGAFCSQPFAPITLPAIQADPITWPATSVTIPGATFLLQDGSIGPVYPTFAGALVYDLELKKWGKLKLQYKQLLDYSPLNNRTDDIIDSNRFGVRAGAVLADGLVYLFDTQPSDSYIKYGKIGYYRLGMTTTEEVRAHFRTASTGSISVETSLDGVYLEASFGMATSFDNAREVVLNGGTTGRWHNIKVSGNYDISHLEYRGTVQGRR
jgi:hypothetical protein